MAAPEAWQQPIRKVGIIGLAGIGQPICKRLAGHGHRLGFEKVAAFDANRSILDGISEVVIIPCNSVADLVDMVDLILLCLPDDGAVGKIARSHEGLLDGVRQGQIIVDHGWSSFELTRQLGTAFATRGAAFLDAPIEPGGDAFAAIDAGRLALSIGGDALAIEAASPSLRCFASSITPVGPQGSAQVVRHLSDLIALQTFAALAESLMTARAFGIEGDTLFDVLAKGNGTGLGHHRLAAILGSEDADAKERTSINDAGRRLKDAIQLAKGKKLALTGADCTLALIEKAMERGLGDGDLSGLLSVIEPEPGIRVRDHRRRA